jgi:hypothetical protein
VVLLEIYGLNLVVKRQDERYDRSVSHSVLDIRASDFYGFRRELWTDLLVCSQLKFLGYSKLHKKHYGCDLFMI